MKSSDVRGVLAERQSRDRREPVEYAPENLHISRDEFIRRRAQQKEANAAAERAKNEVLAKHGILPKGIAVAQTEQNQFAKPKDSGLQEKLEEARKKLVAAQEKLKSEPQSVYYNKRVRDLNELVESIESDIE